MRHLPLILIFITTTSIAQIKGGSELFKVEKARYEKLRKDSEKLMKENAAYLDLELEKLAGYGDRVRAFDAMINERESLKKIIASDIKAAFGRVNIINQVFSRKTKFYTCLEDFLQSKNQILINECRRLIPVHFNPKEEKEINDWHIKLGYTESEARNELKKYKELIVKAEAKIKKVNEYQSGFTRRIKNIEAVIEHSKKLEIEYEELKKYKELLSCNSNTPDINLEAALPYPGATFKGPFYEVPRDHQDGLSTCYANTAKNLLIGLSGGKSNASFLDLALLYKRTNKNFDKIGLDKGKSCEALKEIKEQGYCPQDLAPLEIGEKNPAIEGSFGGKVETSLYVHSMALKLFNDYLKSTGDLKRNPAIAKEISGKIQWIVNQLKANPRIKVPLPMLRVNVPPIWSLLWTYNDHKQMFKVSEKKFLDDFNNEYKSFYPHYLQAVLNSKSPDQIFEIFKEKMAPFITKYAITKEILNDWVKVYKSYVRADYNDPMLKQSVKESLAFLKTLTGKEDAKDDDFLLYCLNHYGPGLDFLGNLFPLIEKMRALKADPSKLLTQDGKFAESADFMQLAIAPACLHPENRRPFTSDIYCEDSSDIIKAIKDSGKSVEEQTYYFRERVVMSLLKGMPLGNTYSTGEGAHINTIVGMRVNPNSKKCEYLIRESQDGRSHWQDEYGIFSKIESLIEVRKR